MRIISTTDSKSSMSCMTSLVTQVFLYATADPRVTSIEESFSSKSNCVNALRDDTRRVEGRVAPAAPRPVSEIGDWLRLSRSPNEA
ncbi:hypothetical protein NUW54_g11448 [Trametes sanguinea]|uniref:Uncharacterized protein n=1 Tax=Trametes sanguinea TaxID=158606 RepID=A0ACC1NE70_9APHY|nr:hypothetical protein NUW54_g11448 [Trametes sanguinea]